MLAGSTHCLEVPTNLQPFIEAAMSRLGYLHPDWRLRVDGAEISAEIVGEGPQEILREIRYALYREKILAETLDMRRDLLRMIARS